MVREVTPDEVQAAFDQGGCKVVETFNSSSRGRQFVLDRAPCCGYEQKQKGERKFSIAENSGLWNCLKCGTSGNLFHLKRLMGVLDQAFKPINAGPTFATRQGTVLRDQERVRRGGHASDTEAHKPLDMRLITAMEAELWKPRGKVVLEYLRKRGFTDETIKYWRLGFTERAVWKCGCGMVETKRGPRVSAPGMCGKCGETFGDPVEVIAFAAVPVTWDGQAWLVKYRSVEGKRFEREAGCRSVLYGLDAIGADADGRTDQVVICESELDAVSMWQYGHHVVCSLTTGAPAAADHVAEFREQLAAFDSVLICMDMDEPGDEAAEAIASVLGKHRCARVQLPHKDANKCLELGVSKETVDGRLQAATSFAVNAVQPFSAYKEQLWQVWNPGGTPCVKLDSVPVDRLWGGMRDGELTIVTGDTGSGKSTWCKWLALRVAKIVEHQHRSVLVGAFEDGMAATVRVLVNMQGLKPTAKMRREEAEQYFDDVARLPMFGMGEWSDQSTFDGLMDSIEWGVRRYGLWMVVLDHFHWIVDNEERETISRRVKQLKQLTKDTGVHIVLVVHPTKLRYGKNGVEIMPDLNDLMGSSEFKKYADNVWRISRPRNEHREVEAEETRLPATATLLKCRHEDGTEGSVPLHFNRYELNYIPVVEAPQVEEGSLADAELPPPNKAQDKLFDDKDEPFWNK